MRGSQRSPAPSWRRPPSDRAAARGTSRGGRTGGTAGGEPGFAAPRGGEAVLQLRQPDRGDARAVAGSRASRGGPGSCGCSSEVLRVGGRREAALRPAGERVSAGAGLAPRRVRPPKEASGGTEGRSEDGVASIEPFGSDDSGRGEVRAPAETATPRARPISGEPCLVGGRVRGDRRLQEWPGSGDCGCGARARWDGRFRLAAHRPAGTYGFLGAPRPCPSRGGFPGCSSSRSRPSSWRGSSPSGGERGADRMPGGTSSRRSGRPGRARAEGWAKAGRPDGAAWLVNPRDKRGYRLPDWPCRPPTRSLF